MGLDADDRINLLGHWLDHDRGEVMAADADALSARSPSARNSSTGRTSLVNGAAR